MINLDKYRKYDYLTVKGYEAIVETENEQGELVNHVCSKNASWIKKHFIINDASDFQQMILGYLNSCSDFDLTSQDVVICGDTLQFTNRENGDGFTDEKGEYWTNYILGIEINGIQVEETDLYELFPCFTY